MSTALIQSVVRKHVQKKIARDDKWKKHLPKDMLKSFEVILQTFEDVDSEFQKLLKNIDKQLDDAYAKKDKLEEKILKGINPETGAKFTPEEVKALSHWEQQDLFDSEDEWREISKAVQYLEHLWSEKRDGIFGSTGKYMSRIKTEFEQLARGWF